MQRSSTTIYAGVPFGVQSIALDGVFIPHISVANYSRKTATVTVLVANSNERSPKDGALTTEALPQPHTRTLTLKAGETNELVLDDARNQSGLLHSIEVVSDQASGLVESKVVSRGNSSLYQVELLGKDAKDMDNAGGHPWNVQGDHESHLLLFNPGTTPTTFVVHICAGTSPWEKKYVLAPSENRELSINRIIRDQIKDDKGRTLSPNLTAGVVFWTTVDPNRGTGRLMDSSLSTASARNFSCGYIVVVCGLDISIYDDGFIPFDDDIAYGDAAPEYCVAAAPNLCYDLTPTPGGGGASFTWTLGNTGIVNFNTPGDQYGEFAILKGISPGSTYADVTAIENGCASGGGGSPPPSVAELSCTTVTRGQSTTCTAAGPSGSTFSGWQFKDSSGNTVSSSSTSNTWSGTAVQSGTVSVNINTGDAFLTYVLTVNPRGNFAFTPVNPIQQSEGYNCDGTTMSVPNPPNGSGTGDKVGLSCLVEKGAYVASSIGGDGPNTGYTYISSASNAEQYNWIIAPDVQNPQSSFYKAQCGNWNGTTGYISGSNLNNDTVRHESGSVESHYINYKTAQEQNQNNLGVGFESLLQFKPTNFSSYVNSQINSRSQTILTDFEVEPCGTSVVNYNSTCHYDGPANFGGISKCSQ